MKKFLLVLLIAVAATATVQIETSELNNWFTDWLKKIGQFFKALGGKLKQVYEWLKENGYWDQIVELVKKYGVPKAIEFCTNVFHAEDLCTDIINLLASFIK